MQRANKITKLWRVKHFVAEGRKNRQVHVNIMAADDLVTHEAMSSAASAAMALTMYMMTSPNGNIFRVTGLLWRESTGHWWIPVTKASDVFFDLRLNKRLSKQSRRRWFETSSRSLWRHRNEGNQIPVITYLHEDWFQLPVPSQCLALIGKVTYLYNSSKY